LPSGSFRAVVYIGVDPLTGSPRYVRETAKTHADAEKALTKFQRQVDENKAPKSSITLATAVEQWMEVAELERTTRERYEDLIGKPTGTWAGCRPRGSLAPRGGDGRLGGLARRRG
jgi:hypothetical protein